MIQTLDTVFWPGVGEVKYLRIHTENYDPLSWRELWDIFSGVYPDRWALEMFPPENQLVDEANVYHLWLMPKDWTCANEMNLFEKYT